MRNVTDISNVTSNCKIRGFIVLYPLWLLSLIPEGSRWGKFQHHPSIHHPGLMCQVGQWSVEGRMTTVQKPWKVWSWCWAFLWSPIPFPRVLVLPAAQWGGSSPPKVSCCQSRPTSLAPLPNQRRRYLCWYLDGSWFSFRARPGRGRGGSSYPDLGISSCTLFPVSSHLRSSGLEAGPTWIIIQRKLGLRSSGHLGSKSVSWASGETHTCYALASGYHDWEDLYN